MRRTFKILAWLAAAGLGCFIMGILATGIAYLYVAPSLPSVEILKDIHLQTPLRIYTRDGRLIAAFGEKRRIPLRYDEIPPLMIHAFIAAEDERFFEHPGVDYQGILRATLHLALTGQKSQGGGTITMQVARNFFLTRKKNYLRKVREVFLALKIERELTKKEILDLYLNKIYLGNRAYGVGAAAQVYYGADIHHLTLPQIAMIAGLPQAPSVANPLANPKRALERRAYVLGRMHSLGYITDSQYETALLAPVTATFHDPTSEVNAPYLAEMVRDNMVKRYGNDAAYTAGYKVVTTLDSRLQPLAQRALRTGLENYTQRHGFRGPAGHADLPEDGDTSTYDGMLAKYPVVGGLHPALAMQVADKSAHFYVESVGYVDVGWKEMDWARRYIDANHRSPPPANPGDILKPGDIVYLSRNRQGVWSLAQVPTVQGALVSLDPFDGAITALTGGFDFSTSKFNRVIQAQRQPGSSFKPLIYSAAIADGLTPATVINDAPVVVTDNALEDTWRPGNYSGNFHGPTRLRVALAKSLNLVSIRVLQRIGVGDALAYLRNFGFQPSELPRNLSLALGSASVSPLEMARAYAVLDNGGFLITPYYIQTIFDAGGNILYRANPAVACGDCPPPADQTTSPGSVQPDASRAAGQQLPAPASLPAPVSAIPATATRQNPRSAANMQPPAPLPPLQPRFALRTISPQNAYLIRDMMRDVIRHGTGVRALQLGRTDLSGKTGTTNDFSDAWFGGFNHNLVAFVWVGFDQVQTLGRQEEGAHAALPIWMDFIGPALKGTPNQPDPEPPGLITVRIDAHTGLLCGAEDPNALFETFIAGHLPAKGPPGGPKGKKQKQKADDLF